MVVIIGIALFFYLLVIWFFAFEAIMIEGKESIAALGRSRELVRGNWWRLFGVGVVFVLIFGAVSIAGGIAGLVLEIFSPVPGQLAFTAATVLVFPVMSIGRTLVYLDLRVRKENYNLGVLAAEAGA